MGGHFLCIAVSALTCLQVKISCFIFLFYFIFLFFCLGMINRLKLSRFSQQIIPDPLYEVALSHLKSRLAGAPSLLAIVQYTVVMFCVSTPWKSDLYFGLGLLQTTPSIENNFTMLKVNKAVLTHGFNNHKDELYLKLYDRAVLQQVLLLEQQDCLSV